MEVVLIPRKGAEYSEERVEAFKADMLATPWPDVEVDAIPF